MIVSVNKEKTMGLSTHVYGVRNLGGKFQDMIDVKHACEKAGVEYPEEVREYFKFPQESEALLRCDMEEINISKAIVENDYFSGAKIIDVDLKALPKEVKLIRFKMSS